jgi:molybdopterin/thiamine biosynthesis adenylyltransferase
MTSLNYYFKKYEKQIILKEIGFSGQKKIKNAKVLIVGMGGLGCPLLIYLANIGIQNIGIIDHDKIELTNLNRQILFSEQDIGKSKVIQAYKKIRQIDKKIKIRIFEKKLEKKNIKKIFKKFDIICDGTDNFETRLLINDYSKIMKKILISGAINKFDGHLFKFDFRSKSPCFRCFMSEVPISNNNCSEDGVSSPIAGIIGSLQANEVLKTILDLKSNLSGKILVFNSLENSMRRLKILKNPGCVNKC